MLSLALAPPQPPASRRIPRTNPHPTLVSGSAPKHHLIGGGRAIIWLDDGELCHSRESSCFFPRFHSLASVSLFSSLQKAWLRSLVSHSAMPQLKLISEPCTVASNSAAQDFLPTASSVRPSCDQDSLLRLPLYSGLVLARLYSYAASGLPSSLGYALHVGEAIGVVLGVAAWLALNRSSASAAQHLSDPALPVEDAEVLGLGVQVDPAGVRVGRCGSWCRIAWVLSWYGRGLGVRPAYAAGRRHRRGPG